MRIYNNDQIEEMSETQKNLHLAITVEKNQEKLKEMRVKRKKIARTIQRRLKTLREKEIDKIALNILFLEWAHLPFNSQ